MVRICVDTDFLIAYLMGNEQAVRKMQFYLYEDLAVSAITAFELRCIVKNEALVNNLLNQLTTLPITDEVANIAAHLILEYKQLTPSQALAAATCLHYRALLLTGRKSTFDFIKGLRFV